MELADWTAGRARLWRPFWIGGTGVVALVSFLVLLLILIPLVGVAFLDAAIGALLLWTLYSNWVAVCVWRCAPNVDSRGWFYLARFASPVLFLLPWLVILIFALGDDLVLHS